jgi:hypothetical protein
MRGLMIVFCFICLSGCGGRQGGKSAPGPLSQMKGFQVMLYADSNQEQLFNVVVESLKQWGNVQIADAPECPLTSNRAFPAVLFSLGGLGQDSVRVYAEVAVQPNHYKTGAQIWTSEYTPGNLPMPVIMEDGSVAFKRENEAAGTERADMPTVATRLVAKFAAQYRCDNPGNDRPSFHVYRSFL